MTHGILLLARTPHSPFHARAVAKRETAAYHAVMNTSSQDPEILRAQLHELRVEHRDLDEAIARLVAAPPPDELMLRRLKKRKLALKDRITFIEGQLTPDELA